MIFPYILVAPAYFAKKIQLGGMMQTASAFSSVQGALSFFITIYRQLAEWQAVVNRLDGFEAGIAAARDLATRDDRIHVVETAGGGAIDLKGLALRLPNGTPLVNADGFSLRKGERTLVTGPSGSGKSTLFRAIAGIWPFGAGSIAVPAGATLMMLPQRPYFPTGSLRGAVEYPGQGRDVHRRPDQQCDRSGGIAEARVAARRTTGTGIGRSRSANSSASGSRARCCTRRNYLFLDEATASLDEPSEAALYRLLEEKLPATTIVSIGHRSTLDAFHQRNVVLVRDGERFALQKAARAAERRPDSAMSGPDLSKPAPRPGLAAHPAVPDIGERGQQHRAGQHRRQQERPWQIA